MSADAGDVGAWVAELLAHPELSRMGHHQRAEDGNLGLGWIYYGLARSLRPQTAVVIGSWRGFVPLVLGRALADNLEDGEVIFVDPSLVDDFWTDAEAVDAWFEGFGVGNVRHVRMTTQDYVLSAGFDALGPVGLLFVDGYHSHAQARFDHEAFVPKLADDAVVLFHDSVRVKQSRIYGEENIYEHHVVDYMDELRDADDVAVFDLPLADGVTLVRHLDRR